jgi:hypothetical protein
MEFRVSECRLDPNETATSEASPGIRLPRRITGTSPKITLAAPTPIAQRCAEIENQKQNQNHGSIHKALMIKHKTVPRKKQPIFSWD